VGCQSLCRDQAGAFGMGQQAARNPPPANWNRWALQTIRRYAAYRQAYQQSNLSNGARNSVLEGRVRQRIGDDLSAYYGARTAQDQSHRKQHAKQPAARRAAYTLLDKRLTCTVRAEIGAVLQAAARCRIV